MINTVLSLLVDQAIRLDPEVHGEFSQLAGHVFKIEVTGLGLVCYLHPGASGLTMTSSYAGKPDVVIAGTPVGLAKLGMSTLLDGGKHHEDVSIIGDVELAQVLSQLMKKYHIDWEALLANAFGDTLAHLVGRTVRSTANWGQDVACKMQKNFSDYLQEEIRLMPPREEVEDFMNAVDNLRDDVSRLDALFKRS